MNENHAKLMPSPDGRSVDSLMRRDLTARDASGNLKFSKDQLSQARDAMRGVAGHDVRTGADAYLLKAGRNLDARDAGADHIVVSADFADPLDIKLGSHLVYAEGGKRVPFTVVGITESNNFMVMAESVTDIRYMGREGLTAPSPSHNSIVFLKIAHRDLSSDLAILRQAFPKSLVLDLSNFLEFTNIIDKLALFPEIIAALSLFAGVIIIANTVALAMLERRREIGVIKAVGARRRTILQFLLVEHAIVGFLGAAAGVGLAMLAASLVAHRLFQMATSYDWLTVGTLILLGVVLAVGASALTALPASSEKPLRVLRYE